MHHTQQSKPMKNGSINAFIYTANVLQHMQLHITRLKIITAHLPCFIRSTSTTTPYTMSPIVLELSLSQLVFFLSPTSKTPKITNHFSTLQITKHQELASPSQTCLFAQSFLRNLITPIQCPPDHQSLTLRGTEQTVEFI